MLLDPVRSVIDFAFYREVPQKSMLRAAGYLVYLELLVSIGFTASLYFKVDAPMQEVAEWLSESMPAISFSDGKASSPLTAPMVLRYPRDNRLGILIDTNRATPVSYDEMAKDDIVLCLTHDSLYFLDPRSSKLEQRPLSAMKTTKPITIAGDFYPKFAKYVSRLLYPVVLLALWIFFFYWRLLTSLFYALVGLLINAFVAADLNFLSFYKLAVYAQTPVTVLEVATRMLGRPLPLFVMFPLGFLVTSAYLWQAVRQSKLPAAA